VILLKPGKNKCSTIQANIQGNWRLHREILMKPLKETYMGEAQALSDLKDNSLKRI